jgi:hypothetical protein
MRDATPHRIRLTGPSAIFSVTCESFWACLTEVYNLAPTLLRNLSTLFDAQTIVHRRVSRPDLLHCQSGILRMRQKLSGQELHARYCPVKNTKSALFLVVSFAVVAFVGWKGLHRPLAPPSFVELIFAILLVAAMLATLLVPFTCFRERLLLGLFIVSLVTGEVVRFVPSLMGKHAEMIKSGKLALSLLGLIVSLSMLVQSVANPHVRPSGSLRS